MTFFYELATLTIDVTCAKAFRDGENILVSFCQMSALIIYNLNALHIAKKSFIQCELSHKILVTLKLKTEKGTVRKTVLSKHQGEKDGECLK